MVTTKKSPWSKPVFEAPVNAGLFVLALYPPWNTPIPAAIDWTCAKLTPSVAAVPVATPVSLLPPKATSASASPHWSKCISSGVIFLLPLYLWNVF